VATKIGPNSMQTYRGVADAWECDQMQHMNVRFIGERFSKADSFLFASLGFDQSGETGQSAIRLETEKLTFSKEILPGKPLLIESSFDYAAQSNKLWVRHDLKFVDTGVVSATSIARHRVESCPEALRRHSEVSSREASLAAEHASMETSVILDPQVALSECGRNVLSSIDYGNGDVSRETLVRLINHAASCAGLDRGRRHHGDGGAGTGSAALEILLKRCAPARLGMQVVVMSGMKARSAKTITVLHRVIDTTTAGVIAEAASTHVFFEIASRAAIPIPADVSPLVFWG
jgi:acyl-CoA thioester hydrolase